MATVPTVETVRKTLAETRRTLDRLREAEQASEAALARSRQLAAVATEPFYQTPEEAAEQAAGVS